MESIDFSQLCPRCGGKLESEDTIESLKTGSPTDFFSAKTAAMFIQPRHGSLHYAAGFSVP